MAFRETTEEPYGSGPGVHWGRVGGLVGLGLGAAWLSGQTFQMDPRKLRHLHQGLQGRMVGGVMTPSINWWEVAGLPEGKVRGFHVGLELAKAFEESIFTIPRTFDIFSIMSQGLASPTGTPGTRLQFDREYVSTFQDYLEAEVGRPLTADERFFGLELREYATGEKGLLSGKPLTEVGLFAQGAAEGSEPIMAQARVMQRFWAPPGSTDYRDWHRSRLAATRQRIHRDVKAVPGAFVEREVEHMGRISGHPFLITGGKNRWQAHGRTIHAVATDLSSRYFRMLDDPVEILRDVSEGIGGSLDRILERTSKSTLYDKVLRNRLGVGGPAGLEGAGFFRLWGRHAVRMGAASGALWLGWNVADVASRSILDRPLSNVIAGTAANVQMAYANISDTFGLTSLSQSQERDAPGSTSLLGLAAFPASAYLTGYLAGQNVTKIQALRKGDWAWAAMRQKTEILPSWLRWIDDKSMTRGRKWGIVGAAIAAAFTIPFIPGAIGSSKTPEELGAEIRGEERIPIRKGRFWEFGRTPYEGGAIERFEESFYQQTLHQSRERELYGEYAGRPFARLWKDITDPYWKERLHYEDRPFPITGPSEAGFGPLGTLWAMTFGRLLKPPRLMHTEEMAQGAGNVWEGEGAVITGRTYKDTTQISEELGGLAPSAPTSPYDIQYQSGDLFYRMTEATGLPGFTTTAAMEWLTGSQDIFADRPILSSASDLDSMRREYWDMDLGGFASMSEAYRRFNPNKRFQVDESNPLWNTMPSWMPGENYYEDFNRGDPMSRIKHGEARLPGEGYVALHPELEGVDPEDWPAAYRMDILADVAPWSKELRIVKKQLEDQASRGALNEGERGLYERALKEMDRKKKGREFVSREEERSLRGELWQAMKRIGRANPIEHLLPLSPVHKFSGDVDVVSAYGAERVWSTDYPSWGRPLEHFVLPAARAAGRAVGIGGIPSAEQERRDIQEHFDMLQYVKQRALSKELDGNERWAATRMAENTMFGADPFSRKEMIRRVVERRDRDYIDAMMDLSSVEEQSKALDITPAPVSRLLKGQYEKTLYAQIAMQDSVTQEQAAMLDMIERDRATEGQEATQEDWEEYRAAVDAGDWKKDDFPDWLRMRRAQRYFAEGGLPGPDWIGWRPDVSLDDVKLKVVMEEGRDFHDFSLWDSDVRALARKPYIEDAAAQMKEFSRNPEDQLWDMLSKSDHSGISIRQKPSGIDTIEAEIERDPSEDYKRKMTEMGLATYA